MSKQRRSFSTEFKHDAAVLVLDKGYTLSAASRAVGIGETALRRWVSQLQLERGGSRHRARRSRQSSSIFSSLRRVLPALSSKRTF